MVIFGSNMLLLFLDPNVKSPIDPKTGNILENAKKRVEFLIYNLSQERNVIGIPTPVVSEVLVHAESAGPEYLAEMGNSGRFEILPFDSLAAIEVAAMTASAVKSGNKRGPSPDPWQKLKIDRQIIAIGLVEGVTRMYADDTGLLKLAKAAELDTVSIGELPEPPEDPQGNLDL